MNMLKILKDWIIEIMRIMFIPLIIAYLLLVVTDGVNQDIISPFIIISDFSIPLIFVAIGYGAHMYANKKVKTALSKKAQWTIHTSIASIIAIITWIALQDSLILYKIICALIIMVGSLSAYIAQNKSQKRWAIISIVTVCILATALIISFIAQYEIGFISFDFWNHYNSSKVYSLTGVVGSLLLSYQSFYVLIGSILNLTNTSIANAQIVYTLSVAMVYLLGAYSMYYIGCNLGSRRYGIISAIIFALFPMTTWGGAGFFIPNTLSLIVWPLLFYFGMQKRSKRSIFLFILSGLVIFLYHPWDLGIILPAFIIWKVFLQKHVKGFILWFIVFSVGFISTEIILFIFAPDLFFSLHDWLPNFYGIYNNIISTINTQSSFNPQVLFTLKNIFITPLAIIGSLFVIIRYIQERNTGKLQPITKFLLAHVILLYLLLFLGFIFAYNFRIVVFVLFVCVPLAAYMLHQLSRRHIITGSMILGLSFSALLLHNVNVYTILNGSTYSSQSESQNIYAGLKQIDQEAIILTDPYSRTFLIALGARYRIHTNPDEENEYYQIFHEQDWTESQIKYIQTWDIKYIAITNRTVEWARTGKPTTAVTNYLSRIDSFISTKETLTDKLSGDLKAIYKSDEFSLYQIPEDPAALLY